MRKMLDRRGFLKLAGASAAGWAIGPLPPRHPTGSIGLARVALRGIGLYREPAFRSERLALLSRDDLLPLLEQVRADEGPSSNPVWFRVADGYVHSANLQHVRWMPQPPETRLPAPGAVFEVSVPYTRSYELADPASKPRYRLYYQSTAWVEAVETGADGRSWYRILDDRLRVRYYARAEHLRRVLPEELTPISPEIPTLSKRIVVLLASQELIAYERERAVLHTRISSGIPDSRPRDNGLPTATPTGRFYVDRKMPRVHMGDGYLTADLEAYELPGVPWVGYFTSTGVAFHGTYWHTDFGRPRSHGCINMRTDEAKWLYRWTSPVIEPTETYRIGLGTPVDVV
jgi:hypothetical protein